MPKRPIEQTSPYELLGDPATGSGSSVTTSHRQQDRGGDDGDDSSDDDGDDSSDDDGDSKQRRHLKNRGGQDALTSALPTLIRFKNLRSAGIVSSWPELIRLIDLQNFPPGILLSPNVRAWRADDVQAWLAQRPTTRKAIPTKQNAEATSP